MTTDLSPDWPPTSERAALASTPTVKDPQVVLDFDKIVAESAAYKDHRAAIKFEKGGKTFAIPAPFDWPDEFVALQARARETGNADPVAMTRALIGDEQYTEFSSVGGNAMKFMAFFDSVFDDVGESEAS